MTAPETITLPLVWRKNEIRNDILWIGDVEAGFVFAAGPGFGWRLRTWAAEGHCDTREAAQAALIAAVRGEP